MVIEEFWVGTRVKHNKFGLGTVVFIGKEGGKATVDFDLPFENNRRRITIASVLAKVEEKPKPVSKPKDNDSQIKIGWLLQSYLSLLHITLHFGGRWI